MKKILSFLLVTSLMLSMYVPTHAEENVWKMYYVSTEGSDSNPGTQDAPFKTLQAAKDAVRTVNKQMQGDIVVNIAEGYYYLDEMLDFRVEDSGFNGHRVIYRGSGETKPVVSGGKRVTGFKKSEYDGIYVADYSDPEDDVVLQLSVDGKRRYVAKAANLIKGVTKPEKYDTEEWYENHPNDFERDKYNYYNPDTEYRYDGMYISKKDFGFYENPQDIMFMWDRCWVTNIVPVEKIEQDPDRSDILRVIMEPGLWNDHRKSDEANSNNTHPTPAREFTVMNAFELLDEPGEFYYNRQTKKLYYMPTEDENMETAVVIVPKLETLVYIDGNDVDDKVKNLTFENIQFSDSQWDYNLGFSGQQATNISGNGLTVIAPRAIFVERADGIEFKNNIICNVGGSALDYYNAVTNSSIVGNALYDIGESAILSGARNHADIALGGKTRPDIVPSSDGISNPVPDEVKDEAVDLCAVTTTSVTLSHMATKGDVSNVIYPGFPSSSWTDETENGYYYNNVTWIDKYRYVNTAWKDSYSAAKGEKPYALFEFVRPYSIEQVSIAFSSDVVTDSEKSDFEILASNDITFAEGTYKVIATQNGKAPNELNHYPFNDSEKYKYVMIRKLGASDFALSRVWIATKDLKPFVKHQRCNGIVIENNIAQRVGVDASRSIGLIVAHGENFRIKHNEFIDVGYSGTSIGYAWHLSEKSCFNMDVGYNYVYDTCQTMHDGGGMYTLGAQPNSHYYNNYIERANLGLQGYYTDNGTRYETIENNYVESAMYILSPYASSDANGIGIMENTYRNNFGTHTVSNDKAKDLNNYEDAIYTVIGQPQREAYDTYTNAGLEKEYEHLRELIPEGRDNLYSRYDYYKIVSNNERAQWKTTAFENAAKELEYTLDNAQFGQGLGVYPDEYKEKLSNAYNYMISGTNPDEYIRTMAAKDFHEELKSTLVRYSIDETITLCEELLLTAKGEDKANYPEAAVKQFETAITKSKQMSQKTPEEEYDKLTYLEKAYNALITQKYSDMIISATVPGAVETKIDSDTDTVTIYVRDADSFVTEELEIKTENNAPISGNFAGKIDLSAGINVPVYNKAKKEYRMWTVKAEVAKLNSTSKLTKDSEWLQNSGETGFVKKSKDYTALSGNRLAYMSKTGGEVDGTTIEFAPMSPAESKSFNLILGANFSEGFDYGNTDAEYNHCIVEFKDGEAKFYKTIEGKKVLMDTVSSGIKWNEKNTLTYKIEHINENTHVTVNLNGKLIFSEVIKKCSYGRYMGFYNPDAVIHIY